MTDEQKQFIWLAFAEKKTYSEIEKQLNVPRTELTQWTKSLENEWRPISALKNIHGTKKITVEFRKFHDWYKSMEQDKKCCYCGITEAELKILFDSGKVETKSKRGRKLELDRKEPNSPYDNLDNIVFACFWCNNAKTDTFTHEEFLEIGKVISTIWKQRFAK